MRMIAEIERRQTTLSTTEILGRLGKISFPILLFLVAFLPRSLYLVARSTIWHIRAGRFVEAILGQDWEATLEAPHPGVTTMWLAGIGREVGGKLFANWPELSLVERMSIELVPLVLVISLGIVLAYFILVRLFNRQIAVVSTLLLALDPFHIYISKTLHVDGLMATFIMLSVLFLWIYIVPSGQGRRAYVVLSGIFAGLAMLSKTPALFAIPYCLLTLAFWQLNSQLADGRRLKSVLADWRQWWSPLKKIGFTFAVWFLALSVIYLLLWPSMWVQPIETLRQGFGETFRFVGSPHPTKNLFLGQTTIKDPGWLFYPVNLLIRSTAITLPFFLFSVTLLFNRKVERYQKHLIFLAFVFVGFFTLQMTLGEKKADRYLLAAFEFMILLAGIGAVYFARWVAGGRRWLLNLLLILVVFLQALISVPRNPYYGTHFNRLLGGPKTILGKAIVAGQGQGEGLDQAGEFLSNLPDSENLTAGVLIEEAFGRYFDGLTVVMIDESVDYLVFARNWMARETRAHRWEVLWERYQDKEPDFSVSFDGIPYVWVYKVDDTSQVLDFEYAVNAELDGQIRLLGYDLAPDKVFPGEEVRLLLYWEAIERPKEHYTVFTHLLDSEELLWGQTDHSPLYGDYSTGNWNPGDIVRDQYDIEVSPEAHPGPYQIELGMYLLETLERLPISSADGELLPQSRILIPGPEVLPRAE